MAARPTWQGHLRLSLVTCPVALYSATSTANDIHFNLINPKTDNRIRMVTTDPDTGPVNRSDLVKGYEVEKGRYIIVTDDDLASVKLESTKILDIERFVDVADIDRLYWNDPFYLVPDGKIAAEAYSVIREAMSKSGRIALGRVVLHTRERLMALEPQGRGIVAWSLRTRGEVRDAEGFFRDIPDVTPNAGMIENRLQDHRAAGGRLRSEPVRRSLRGGAEGPDRQQAEGPAADSHRRAGGHQRHRPDGRASRQPAAHRTGGRAGGASLGQAQGQAAGGPPSGHAPQGGLRGALQEPGLSGSWP